MAVPTCPSFLKGEAKREWNRQVSNLKDQSILSDTYRNSLAIYCQAWGEYYDIQMALEGKLLNQPEEGVILPKAEVKILGPMRKSALEVLFKLGPQFGWTPSSKADLKINAPAPQTKEVSSPREETPDVPQTAEDLFAVVG